MQNRSRALEIQVAPIPLEPGLPVTGGELWEQHDHPITFLHVHQCLELGYCHSGSGIFAVGDKILPFRAGDVSFINHTEVHLAQSAPGSVSRWSWVFLDPIRLAGLNGRDALQLDPTRFAGPRFNNIVSGRKYPAIARVVRRLVAELRERGPGHALVFRALAIELMVLMQRYAVELGVSAARPPGDYRRIAPALEFMARHYAAPVGVAALARRCGLSAPHFRRLFVRALGRAPAAYWHDLRLRMAASLLRTTTRSVLEVAHEVGYGALSSFNRKFRAGFGCTPRDWRRGRG